MGNKPVISKQQILDTAFAIASESGLSGLSIREVARACNVAVGTVYNSYPTKYDLVNDVVGRFWNEALADSMPGAIAGDDFIGFCEGLGPRTAVRVRVGQHALVHQTKRSPMRNPVHPPAPHAVRAPIRMR